MTAKTATTSSSSKTKKSDNENVMEPALVSRAVVALLKHHEETSQQQEKQSLLGNTVDIQVQIGLDRVPENPSPKPIRIAIPHPIYLPQEEGNEDPSVCLIVKEESKPWVQELIAEFPQELKYVQKVLGLQSLRTKFKQFEQRRDLLHRYDVFMADDRILPMLAKCLGKNFFKAKKQPIPLRLTRKEALPLVIQRNLSATYMFLSPGTCLTIRAGNTGMSCEALVENVQAIAKNAVPKLPKRWYNIRSISVKTTTSLALPMYSKSPLNLLEMMSDGMDEDTVKEKSMDTQQEQKQQTESNKKRKQETKSPLVRALKKQKQQEEKNDKKKEKEASSKKKKRQENGHKEETPKASKARSVMKEEKEPKAVKNKGTDNNAKTDSFIASKRYKGSKQGYVFLKGPRGIGYYVDEKPVVDKLAMAALAKLSPSPGRKRGGKKRKGQR